MAPRAFVIWLVLLFVAVVNGAFRETLLVPRMDVPRAQVVSTLLLSALILILGWLTVQNLGACARGDDTDATGRVPSTRERAGSSLRQQAGASVVGRGIIVSATFGRASEVGSSAAAIEAEFAKMPGMRLTEAQARRFFGVSASDCLAALLLLVEAGRLVRDPEGPYAWPGPRCRG